MVFKAPAYKYSYLFTNVRVNLKLFVPLPEEADSIEALAQRQLEIKELYESMPIDFTYLAHRLVL
jgi:hypothetical protein